MSIDEPLNVDWDGNDCFCRIFWERKKIRFIKIWKMKRRENFLIRALNKLNSREKLIVSMRFGLDNPDGKEKTQKEVADLLGISQSYISRLEKKIMQRLKREMVRYE